MATTLRNATVSTRIEHTPDGYRVAYDTPLGGFNADELEALQVAIATAQRQIAELSAAPQLDFVDALTQQHDRMAAPC